MSNFAAPSPGCCASFSLCSACPSTVHGDALSKDSSRFGVWEVSSNNACEDFGAVHQMALCPSPVQKPSAPILPTCVLFLALRVIGSEKSASIRPPSAVSSPSVGANNASQGYFKDVITQGATSTKVRNAAWDA
ncbi:hypothetical protein SUGI_0254550 [Cryptomeria japonica]|nr:hypothetical protein SUGI_0254550 [Cryptomeria japonica]